MIYSSPAYQMGASETAITKQENAHAKKEIRRLRRSLKGWLEFRKRNDEVAAGLRKARISQETAAERLPQVRDWALEQRMALELHALLGEIFDSSKLPSPDISKDPQAAVKLAQIAVSGKLPEEATSPSPQGMIWLWPAAVVVGLLLVTIMTKISSDADVAKEKERLECIKTGACTDYGFWLKVGGIALGAWIVWDKFGLREAVGGKKKVRRIRRRK